MTNQEKIVMENLVSAWNTFLDLPIEHPDDQNEFRRAIHSAQLLVLARPGRRMYNAEQSV